MSRSGILAEKAFESDFLDMFSTVDLLAFPALFAAGLDKAAEFLRHQFPMVRLQQRTGFIEVTHRVTD